MTNHGGGPERNPIASRWLETLGNVSFIERPFHPTTLLSVARAAVKGRRRQHDTRRLLANLRESDVRLRTALHAGHLTAWEFDFATSRVAVSAEGRSILGHAVVQEVGVDELMRGITPDDRAKVVQALGHSVGSGEDFAVDLRFGRPDGSISVARGQGAPGARRRRIAAAFRRSRLRHHGPQVGRGGAPGHERTTREARRGADGAASQRP